MTDSELVATHLFNTSATWVKRRPMAVEEVADVLREAEAAGQAVIPWGGGTQQELGSPPTRCDVLLETRGLAGVLAYAPEDLTLSVRAGTTLVEVAGLLAEHRQFLPLEVQRPERATIGGVVATAEAPIRRLRYGGVRDLVIGLEVVLAGGAACRTGGRVVKNVAGYDLCKLFTGSLGTLGVVTAVNLKVQPLPAQQALVAGQFSCMAHALGAAEALSRLGLSFGALWLQQPAAGPVLFQAFCEGFSASVARQVEEAQAAIRGADGQVTGDGDPSRVDTAVQTLCAWRDRESQPRLLLRGSVPTARLASALDALLRELELVGHRADLQVDAGTGTFYARIGAIEESDQGILSAGVESARRALHGLHGHLIVAAGPPALRRAMDPWGAPAAGADLARILKRQLDPAGTLNPGRFAYGI